MKLLDTNHPFFRPLWLRVLIVGIAAGWGTFELWHGQIFWGVVFWLFAILSLHGFFWRFDPDGK